MSGTAMQVRLGELLVERGLVSRAQLEEALAHQARDGRRLGEVLVGMGTITQEQLTWGLSEALHVPFVDLADEVIDLDVARSLPEEVLRRHEAVPILRSGRELTVLLSDPTNRRAIIELEALTGARIAVAVAAREAVHRFLDRAFPRPVGRPGEDPEPIGQSVADLSGVTHAFALLLGAVRDRVGDLYVEPTPDEVIVRARVDGCMVERTRFARELLGPLVFRLRVLAGVPAEPGPRLARIRTRLGGEDVELELLFFGTLEGEAVALRVRPARAEPPTLAALALPGPTRAELDRLLARSGTTGPGGLVLVAGADGPRRAELLYALAQAAAGWAGRVLTVERRAAFVVPGFVQVELPSEFPASAAMVLGQAADVVLVEDVVPAPVCAAALSRAEQGTLVLGGLGLASLGSALAHLAAADLRGPLLRCTRGVVEARRHDGASALQVATLTPALRRALIEGRDPWTSPSS